MKASAVMSNKEMQELEQELAQLERENPEVREASARVDAAVREIIARPVLTAEEREILRKAQRILEEKLHRFSCDIRLRPHAQKVSIMLSALREPAVAETLDAALEAAYTQEL